ncbi:MAG: aminoglycoside phosphotransferase family protein [Polyangiaceae bacterium]
MPETFARDMWPAIEALIGRIRPGARLRSVRSFDVDDGALEGGGTLKGTGYGVPLRLELELADGRPETLVFHTEKPDAFGHDRRADRAADMLLAYDRFGQIPHHVAALDVGAIGLDGESLTSLAEAGEFYLITSYAPGHLYADELRAITTRGALDVHDLAHADALARALAEIHAAKIDNPLRYARAVRDLVGSGEGIFGLIDAYTTSVESAPPERMQRIEALCDSWRWKLKRRAHRLARAHGDFHPFNILFSDDHELALLDSSRGSMGDPADDFTCLAINYVFFAVEHPELWQGAFRLLLHRFTDTYLQLSADSELLDVAAPYFAWRGLVICNPLWYPALSGSARDKMLRLIEHVLRSERFDPAMADEVFA